MEPELYSLAYFSHNNLAGSAAEVQAGIRRILEHARHNNRLRNITGALLFGDGCFAQVLEGYRDDVETTFEAIATDPRHRLVRLLHFHRVARRSFSDWSMAYVAANGIALDTAAPADRIAEPSRIASSSDGAGFVAVLHDLVRRDEVARTITVR